MKMRNLELKNEVYDAPKCEVIEVQNEGVLCASGGDAVELTGGAFGNMGTTTEITDINSSLFN